VASQSSSSLSRSYSTGSVSLLPPQPGCSTVRYTRYKNKSVQGRERRGDGG
jgi:hypothetical protein